METRPFLFVGHDPCLDFVNTRPMVDGRPLELLAEAPDVVAWLVAAGLWSAEEGRRALERWSGTALAAHARALREQMRALAEALVRGRAVPPASLAAVNAALADNDGALRLSRRGARFVLDFAPRAASEEHPLAPVAEAAARLLAERDLALVKRCESRACVLYFYDTTKNHARRWCSMDACGNRAKVAAFRRRRERARR